MLKKIMKRIIKLLEKREAFIYFFTFVGMLILSFIFKSLMSIIIICTMFFAYVLMKVVTKVYDRLIKKMDIHHFITDFEFIKNYKNADWLHFMDLIDGFRLPIIVEGTLFDKRLVVEDSLNQYILPEFVQNHYDELLKSYNVKRNHSCIKVDCWETDNRNFQLNTSRTTAYDSLVTNNAMDYTLACGSTLREVLQYGPFLPTLKESELSNELAFTCIIESSDGFIPFVYKQNKIKFNQSKYYCSASGSFDADNSLNEENEFTFSTLISSLKNQIRQQLFIEEEYLEDFSESQHHALYAYRDFIDGGKPHLLFYIKSTLTREQMGERYKEEALKYNNKNELYWIHNKDLTTLRLTKQSIMLNDKAIHMPVSHLASIILLKTYLLDHKRIEENERFR